jgi:hypothetical protein
MNKREYIYLTSRKNDATAKINSLYNRYNSIASTSAINSRIYQVESGYDSLKDLINPI